MSKFTGKSLKIEIFGASHAEEIGVKLIGLPAGETVDMDALRAFLARRAPGGELKSTRKEPDEPIILSGITDGATDGSLFCAVIKNKDVRREDYVNQRHIPRPCHADFAAWQKYGLDYDMSGGGAFSGRMTAPMCIAGGICKQLLMRRGIKVSAEIHSIGGKDNGFEETVKSAKADGDSVGGIVECVIKGVPAGLGDKLFDGLEGQISSLVFAIPAVKGIEFGAGFKAAEMRGSEHNDAFIIENATVKSAANNHGGILGGISTGMPIVFRAAFKPTPSIALEQDSVDLDTMQPVKLSISGRHDPCIVLRAVPVIEAAAAIAIADLVFSSEKSTELSELRKEIDGIDKELTALFAKRMELCRSVAEFKEKYGLPTLDKKREDEKLEEIAMLAGDEISTEALALYKEIFRLSREYQDRLR